jgi:hypothetical protein
LGVFVPVVPVFFVSADYQIAADDDECWLFFGNLIYECFAACFIARVMVARICKSHIAISNEPKGRSDIDV